MTTLSPLASTLVKHLNLAPHPEGGHFRRTWTAPTHVETPRGQRATASAILFVLDRDEEAAWHLVHSDELWIWSGPGALEIHLGGDGEAPSSEPQIVTLGSPAASNPVQFLVPAGSWQRTFARGQAALATCVVSPEFSFEDWKLASAGE
ncbi:cupin domain-containing protein [Actinomyces sp.]